MASNSSSDPLMGANTTQRPPLPQFAALDFLIPGFSVFSTAIQAYLGVDLNVYIPVLLLASGLTVAWTYFSDYVWGMVEKYLMSIVRIRTDDEIYNMIMTWVAAQKFAQGSRNFIVNTNINSRSWFLWRWNDEEDEGEDTEEGSDGSQPKKKPLQYTPSFGSHFFWYKGNLLLFERHENREQSGFLVVSEREEISISCFGRNPRILKELLIDARAQYMKKDESKTLIYRAAAASNQGGDPSWQRCMSRSSRPFSTVILSEKTKSGLIEDVTDYLNPATRRWYANRGIPYRRGYLLYGPPGTGKSSLSLALAGFFRMRIYMVSLSSPMANEENLATLFAELPRRCVVLLEDIDSAGLTHTREVGKNGVSPQDEVQVAEAAAAAAPGKPAVPVGAPRLSLSGLLNILDGVASQEGRILIMTTNHLEKLDKALIRPGRVDMTVSFGLADADMTAAIFRAIYAPYEGEKPVGCGLKRTKTDLMLLDEDRVRAEEEEEEKARTATIERVDALSKQFAAKIPELEFSPAELQGLLLKHKRDPEMVLKVADQWIIDTRKEKKVKEIEDAENRRKEEEKRKKEEAKKKRKEEKAKAKKRKERAKKRAAGEDTGSESDTESEGESVADSEATDKKEENKDDKDVKDDKEKETDKKDAKGEKKESDVVEVEAEKAETKKEGGAEAATTENENESEPQNDTLEVKINPKGSSDSGYDTPDAK